MSGMDSNTGKKLSGKQHLAQSIKNILTTPIGSRLMRRGYGSLIPQLLDHPANPALTLQLQAATVMALTQWEPRINLQSVQIELDNQGKTLVHLGIERTNTSTPENLQIGLN